MKRNIIWFVLFGIALLPLAVSAVHAQAHLVGYATATPELNASGPASSSQYEAPIVASDMHAALTSEDIDAARASSTKSVDGQLTAETHRSNLASIADALLLVAGREDPANGLGERLRIVAHALQDAEDSSAEAIEKIAFRSSIEFFLFGSDSKNLVLLKNQWAEAQRQVVELKDIQNSMSDPVDGAALATQIEALQKDQVILQRFIAAHS